MTSVRFTDKTKKFNSSLRPGVKTVWLRLQSSNKTLTRNVSGRSRHQITYQALMCSTAAQERKKNFPKTVFWHFCVAFKQANACVDKHLLENNDMPSETSDNQSAIYPFKGNTITWEKHSKDRFSDFMELTLSRKTPAGQQRTYWTRKTPAGQQTTYCFVNLSGCV